MLTNLDCSSSVLESVSHRCIGTAAPMFQGAEAHTAKGSSCTNHILHHSPPPRLLKNPHERVVMAGGRDQEDPLPSCLGARLCFKNAVGAGLAARSY